jgi:hypothetical protein
MILKISSNLAFFIKAIFITFGVIFILTMYLYHFTDDKDIANLPPKDKKKIIDDRFVSLFYYNASIHGGLGDATMYPISNKAKIFTTIYLVIIISGIITGLDL